MSERTDLDRAVADWLAEGPARAPEAPLAAAVRHARAHPRRHAPFGFLRRDPMDRPLFSPVALQPAWAVLLLSLLLVAGIGVALIGSRPDRPEPPAPTPAPTASPAPPPATLQPSVTPGPRLVELDVEAGSRLVVEIVDATGLLVDAVSGPAPTGASVEFDMIEVVNEGPTALRLSWTGSPCDSAHRLRIENATRTIVLERPTCAGDPLPVGRVLILRFAQPVAAGRVDATIIETPGP